MKTWFVESNDLPRPRGSNHVPILAFCLFEPGGRTAAPLSAPSSHVLKLCNCVIGRQTVFLSLVSQSISSNAQQTRSFRFVPRCPSQSIPDQAPLGMFEHRRCRSAFWSRGERFSRSRLRRFASKIGRQVSDVDRIPENHHAGMAHRI